MRVSAPKIIAILAVCGTMSGCALVRGDRGGDAVTAGAPATAAPARKGLFGGGERARRNVGPDIGVNAFLWRATLDTLAFMPMADSDPFGGTYVTDWHAAPERPDERFKVQVYILDTRLRADGLAVQVFRQTRDVNGGWVDASIDPDTQLQIENAILTRARQLRIATLESR
jgi:hypothetical protein